MYAMIHFPFLQQFFTLSNLLIALATHVSSPSLHSTKMLHKIKWPELLFLFFFLFLLLEDIWLGSVLHSSMGCMASYLRVLLLLIGLVSFFSHFNFFFPFTLWFCWSPFFLAASFERVQGWKIFHPLYIWICLYSMLIFEWYFESEHYFASSF